MQGSNEADKGQTLAPGSPAPARTAQVCTTAWRNFYHVPAPAARGSVPSAECGAQRKTLCFSACHCHFKCPLPPDCGSLAALRSLPDPGWQPLQPQPFMGQAEPCLLLTVTPPTPSRAFPPGSRGTAPLVGSPACLSCLLPHLLSVCTSPCSLPALAEPTHPGEHLLVLRGLGQSISSCGPFVGSPAFLRGYLAPEPRAS